MRKIVFRAKNTLEGSGGGLNRGDWVYGSVVLDGERGYIIENVSNATNELYFEPYLWYPVDPETVGQFTGLEDKNDVKIFEGDIVQEDPLSVFIVKFGRCIDPTSNKPDGYQGFYLEQISPGLEMWRNDIYYWCNKGLKVIGNVFENPELLKTDRGEEDRGEYAPEQDGDEEEKNEEEKNEKD